MKFSDSLRLLLFEHALKAKNPDDAIAFAEEALSAMAGSVVTLISTNAHGVCDNGSDFKKVCLDCADNFFEVIREKINRNSASFDLIDQQIKNFSGKRGSNGN